MNHPLVTVLQTGGIGSPGGSLGSDSFLLGLHAVSDLVIAVSFLLIPAAIFVFLRRRRDLPKNGVLIASLFMAFIVAGALVHLVEFLAIWVPGLGVKAWLNAVTAAAALATAIVIWPQIPKLLALPSPRDLSKANLALAQSNASLETTIAWRTHELERANQRFEQALSRSNITVYTQDKDFRYTWIHNPRLGLTQEAMIGHRVEDFLPDGAELESYAPKRRALETGQTVSATVSMPTEDEGRLYFDLTVSPTLDQQGRIDGILCTAVDVTEKRLFEVRLAAMAVQLGTSSRRFEMALEKSAITVFEQDQDLHYTYVYNPPGGTEPDDYLGRTDAEVFSEADQAILATAKHHVLATGTRQQLELALQVGGERRYFDFTLDPKLDAGDEVIGIIGTALDRTEERADEQRMRLMMRELTHRSKNLLAVIQAMARKTASLSDDIDGFITDFSSRLRSMAAAHDLLVSESWQGADLADLIRTSVAQTINPAGEQVRIEGPSLLLSPDTAQNLGLAFHELATNASKYGALACENGRLGVHWTREDGEIRIVWEETGGPTVEKPSRSGFGRVLLERLVGATLNGAVELDFRPEGLRCEISFPDKG